jgi:hypothetical protein
LLHRTIKSDRDKIIITRKLTSASVYIVLVAEAEISALMLIEVLHGKRL